MPGSHRKLGTVELPAHPSEVIFFEPEHPVPFDRAWSDQQRWQQSLIDVPGSEEAVWLLQHPPCYTLGRGASLEHVHFNPAVPPAPLHRIDRGGEVTHHCLGQLVAYPVLDLQRRTTDLHWYLRQLEQVLMDVLAQLGLQGQRLPGFTGLWLDNRKVAAIGVGSRRWITQHGLALNVACDLDGFAQITPCGLKGRAVGCLADWLPGLLPEEVQPLLRDAIAARFGLVWSEEA